MDKLQKVQEALEFYASCSDDCILIEMHRNEDIDDILQIGKKAQAALAELKEFRERLASEELVEEVTKAISLDQKEQLRGQDNPPAELYDPYSWNATAMSIDMSKSAQAAINVVKEK